MEENRYIQIVMIDPIIVALGIVFEGLCVPSAGIVADSIPIKAKNVRAAVAVNALKFDSPLVFNVIK
jgi:hypothetical protein